MLALWESSVLLTDGESNNTGVYSARGRSSVNPQGALLGSRSVRQPVRCIARLEVADSTQCPLRSTQL